MRTYGNRVRCEVSEIPQDRRAGERGGLQALLRSLQDLPHGQALRVHKDYPQFSREADPKGTARQGMLYSSLKFASRKSGIKICSQVTSDGTGDVLIWMRDGGK